MAVHGNTHNLKPSQRKVLEKLGDKRLREDRLITPQLAATMAALSKETNRVVGVLIDRRGRIEETMIGDHKRLYLPDIGRDRAGSSRFRGLRLIRTALDQPRLAPDDITDLSKLHLDSVGVVHVRPDGKPGQLQWAHLIPDNPQRQAYLAHDVRSANELPEDWGEFIAELEAEFERGADTGIETHQNRAMLVYVRTRADRESDARIAELHELCRTAGVDLVETYIQGRTELDPKTAVGAGALEEIVLRALQLGATMLVFGQDLSASQLRNITQHSQIRVIDRTQLILDIFAQRAQTAVGKLQVELAQLKYTLPRLAGQGEAMSRLAGGIGGRGPGETKLETDRRRARDRVVLLEQRIEELRSQRDVRRAARKANEIPVIAIVGYTNAGKSTLLNSLTRSEVLSEDKLFATLDTTTRRLRVPSAREVVLTDTVGFIRDLPPTLREAFRSTLEELHEADLLLHVVDASDPALRAQMASTRQILHELGLNETPRLLVYNKIDRLSEDQKLDVFLAGDGVAISANDRGSLDVLLEAIDEFLIVRGRADAIPTLGVPRDDLALGAMAWEESPPAQNEDAPVRDDDGFIDFSN